MSYVTKFCQSLNTNYLDKLSKDDKKQIKNLLESLKEYTHLIDPLKIHLYYMLYSYFNPTTTLSINPRIIKKLNISNFCNTFIKHSFKTHCPHLKYTAYVKALQKGITTNLDTFTKQDVHILFDIIDEVYFNNMLVKLKKDKLTFQTSKAYKNVAGYCQKTEKGRICSYIITLAPIIVRNPFIKQKYTYQKSSGVLCFSPLDCIIDIMCHEMIHYIILTLCPEYNAPGGHTKQFKEIVSNLFCHTDFRHQIGSDPTQGVEKEDLKGVKYILVPLKGENIKAEILKLNPKTVKAKLLEGKSKGAVGMVPYSSISLIK